MTVFASNSVRLTEPVIETIGNITSSEHPEICTGQTEFENHGAQHLKMI